MGSRRVLGSFRGGLGLVWSVLGWADGVWIDWFGSGGVRLAWAKLTSRSKKR